ncbi:MAG: 50S ribosomal protein L35 [Candidatus Magasanikbacteria bacterium]|nr:50S ribosomal protein L35 [Candidatus Magasanikbacteria bacterium]
MPKLKTRQATAKRFIKTRTGKFLKRKAGQDHFNSRERGKITRNKRRDVNFSKVYRRTFDIDLPHT